MWRQGEHVCIIGDTGSGKTYLETKILGYRKYVVVLKSKGETLQRGTEPVVFKGFKTVSSVTEITPQWNHYVLKPKLDRQRREFGRALNILHKEGGWTVVIDELFHLTNRLGLEKLVDNLLTQGSSEGVTVVTGAQRPAQISRFAISQSIHCCFFMSDGRDVKIIADATTADIKPYFAQLKQYEFVYFNRLKRTIQILNAEQLHPFIHERQPEYI